MYADCLEIELSAELENTDKPPVLARKPVRADARRNEDALLEAAKLVFASVGVDAPVRQIATQAGVGVGTLYRRFPKRADLIAAVFCREVDLCVAYADELNQSHGPDTALYLWLKRYQSFIDTKRGLASALHSGEASYETLADYFRASFDPTLKALLDAAVAGGHVRPGIEPYDLLRAIANLSTTVGDDSQAHSNRMVDLLFDGLKVGA